MKKVSRLIFLLSFTLALMHGCATKTEAMPPDWGKIKTESTYACLRINDTFYNQAVSAKESGSVKNRTLTSIFFPVMQGLDIGAVKIKTTSKAIIFGIQGEEIAVFVGKKNDVGEVACTQRSWVVEISKLNKAEGALGVEKRQIYLYLNYNGDLLVREITARRGVGLLVIPYRDQDVSLYRFSPVE